jgi:hypothetical protein
MEWVEVEWENDAGSENSESGNYTGHDDQKRQKK